MARRCAPEDNGRRGFTLVELILVVTLIGILSAAVVPVFSTSIDNARERRGLRGFVAMMKHGQERAMAEGVEFRLYMQPDDNRYWLVRFSRMDGDERVFTLAPLPHGGIEQLPAQLAFGRLTAHRDRKRRAYYVSFYPSGACDYATIRLERPARPRHGIRITTKGTLGQFEVEET